MSNKKIVQQNKKAEAAAKVKRQIIDIYSKLMVDVDLFPSIMDLHDAGVSREKWRHHFRSLNNLRAETRLVYPELFSGAISERDTVSYTEKAKKALSGKKRFFITAAISGQRVFSEGLSSVKTWQKKKKGGIIILPSLDTAHNLDNEIEWHFDEELLKLPLLFGGLSLNSNFRISDYFVTAKQINPLTGIGRHVQKKGSMIFGSPKQSLEYESVSNASKYPNAGMSSGAITLPNYKTSKGNAMRTAWIATNDHVVGGVIVEIQDDKVYHFRQVQFDENGGFCDVDGNYYLGDKVYKIESFFKKTPEIVRGDIHIGVEDELAVSTSNSLIKALKIRTVAENDLFDGASCNHHAADDVIVQASQAKKDRATIEDELAMVAKHLQDMLKITEKVVVVPSNHDDFLSRYLRKGSFVKDPRNFKIGCKLSDLMLEGKDPFVEGLRLSGIIKNFDELLESGRLCFPGINDDIKFGMFNIVHGHIGRNGQRQPGLAGIEKGWGAAISGHSHTPGILRKVFRVGTLSKKRHGYNNGPSSWTHTDAIRYPNNQVQLINYIDGKYTIK